MAICSGSLCALGPSSPTNLIARLQSKRKERNKVTSFALAAPNRRFSGAGADGVFNQKILKPESLITLIITPVYSLGLILPEPILLNYQNKKYIPNRR
ncbi:MAG: hypothetical protein H5U05_05410 [Candidatus Aminicenantes bacterium]|nr:hypothetical protein [Candidatus Aminicenantes bacterium]